ncbi:Type I restriction enzyme EcoKI specificity protein [Anaerohalosphaera lusitana]|uniref:Type I restriction enzyme EcoKI specificity protein n=1 Tax=Anaerohalosphaera lusitana TaxID=1936003 RepID=A0A1U9NJY4_9BACT|nr:restriction endonuclease subunit S [Anaerohalosphaera lusitana]AQT68231.1 Type I restriction enzyme EcoKI specificity protein [Anaerohalosphaera lusitana]
MGKQKQSKGLPKGWVYATIPNIVANGGVFSDGDWVESKDQDPDGDVRLIQLADVGDGCFKNKSSRFLTEQKFKKLNCTQILPGDVLIARMPDPLGRACIFPGDKKKSVTVVDVCIVRTSQNGPEHRWLVHTINAPQFRRDVALYQSGSTRKRISRKNLAKVQFPLPPLGEQGRIVGKIEELFSDLDAGVAALEKVRGELKRYRQSVLKHAFEGKLTAKWREENKDRIEPADKLLERIANEREKNAKGKKREKLPPLDTSKLPELPEGWVWSRGDDVFYFITSGSRGWAKYYSETGKLFLRMGNLDHDSISLDLSDIQLVQPPSGAEGIRTRVQPDDILISVTADVGMTALVPKSISEAYVNQHVALARSVDSIEKRFLAWFIASSDGGQRQFALLRRGATKAGLGLDDIKTIGIPLASLAEQGQIVAEIEKHFSIADKAEQMVEDALKQSGRLRQSILKKAFEGKLVPQDPNDEPAEKLLERIRKEKQ